MATALARWLQQNLHDRQLTMQAAGVHAGVSTATLSDMVNHDYIPRLKILFRLADYFGTSREQILHLAARMPLPDDDPPDEGEQLTEELLEQFRKLPDAWKPEVIRQVEIIADRDRSAPSRRRGPAPRRPRPGAGP